MKAVFIVFALLAALPALADQAQQCPSEAALWQRAMAEMQGNVQAAVMIGDLRAQLAAAQARIKEIEAKLPKDEKP